jgi:hypothetical protein
MQGVQLQRVNVSFTHRMSSKPVRIVPKLMSVEM